MLPTPHGTYSRKEQSEREGEVGKSGRNPVRFLRRENRQPLPQMQGYLCPWCPGHPRVCPSSTPWHLTWVCPSSHPRPQRLFFLSFPSTPSPGRLVLSPFTRLVRCSEPSSASGDAVIKYMWALPSQNLKSERERERERERDVFKRQNGIRVVRLLQIRSPGRFLLANLRRFYRGGVETGWWGTARIETVDLTTPPASQDPRRPPDPYCSSH